MQTRTESYLRAINNTSGKYNILTFPTHEAYQSNFASMPHTFYLYQAKGIKPWKNEYRQLPENHILLDGSPNQLKPWDRMDIVLSQNKFGQIQIASQIAAKLNIPLISLEHTLPVPTWSEKHRAALSNMRGKINVFISEYSINEWGFDKADPSVRVIRHAINTDLFKPAKNGHNDGKILSVVNDWVNRDIFCGWNIYRRVTQGLPINPVGDTPGFSKPANGIDDLVSKYQNAQVFINSSTVSPIPTALLESMAAGCPIVTTATCMIPEIIKDGVNGFISNDEVYLRDKLIWCLEHPTEAKVLGENARKTIIEHFSLDKHLQDWDGIFKEVVGTGY